MEDTDDNYDRIAPGAQSIELQDEFEGTQDLHPDFNENYDLSGDYMKNWMMCTEEWYRN